MSRPRALVTNDDGIDSPGLRHLARGLADLFDVVVVAPSVDMSGSGTGIGRIDTAAGIALEPADLDGITAYSLSGPPGLAVMAAALGAFGDPPELVVSGVNAGMNTGHSVVHSGTVGAALTARTFKAKGLAISLEMTRPWHWDSAVTMARRIAPWMCASGTVPRVLNVNVPGRPLDEIEGVRWADLDEFGYFRVAKTDAEERSLQLVVAGSEIGLDGASDSALCRSGWVTVTPLSAIEPAPFPAVDADQLFGAGPGDPSAS